MLFDAVVGIKSCCNWLDKNILDTYQMNGLMFESDLLNHIIQMSLIPKL